MSPHPDPLDWRQNIEAPADATLFANEEHAVLALVSIAISIKRIADALHGDEQNTGMKHALAEMANRAFNGWGPSS